MSARSKFQSQLSLAATVAGEDIARQEFVAVLNEVIEVPSFMWGEGCLEPQETVRLKVIPDQAGRPLKVKAVCLPFVYVQDAEGPVRVVDTRQHQLVRLNRKCAKKVWKALRRAAVS